MAVIQVEQVRKTFGARDALTEVSFSIPKGEIFRVPRSERCRQNHLD
ncbi:hypothetical protein ACFTAO_36310 [Paenibacillus rhizoplanae]